MHLNNRISGRWFLVYVLCSLAAVFYIPYFVPMSPSVSDSYLFGYNNRIGVALLLLLVTIGAVWTKGLNLQLDSEGAAQPVARRTLAWSLLGVLLGCVLMYMLVGQLGGFAESSYGIDRTWHASLGKIPYVNFEFAYGVSLLYGPLLLRDLLPINLVQAYYLFWLLNWLLGTLLLYAVINMVDYPTSSKGAIFLLLYGAGFSSIIFTGTHYTFLRYTCPLFFILVVHRLLKRDGGRSRVYAALLAVTFTILLLSISPETAIAHAFACVCIFLLLTPCWNGRSITTFAGLLFALAIVFSVALRIHVLDTLKEFGGGAFNFPIYLAPHILLFIAAFFVCACYVFGRFSEKLVQDNTIGLIAFSVPMMAAALGRCDPFHVFWNGEGIFVASMFYLSGYRVAWKWYRVAFVVILIILPLHYALPIVRSAIVDSIADIGNHRTLTSRSLAYLQREYISRFASPAARARWERNHTYPTRIVPDKIALAVLYPTSHGEFLAPWGYTPNGSGTYLSSEIDYGYFDGLDNAFTLNAAHLILTEINDHPDKPLLLPGYSQNSCIINPQGERQLTTLLFSFPYFRKAVHPESVLQPVCSYILDHYEMESAPSPQNFGYGLWVRRSTQSSR